MRPYMGLSTVVVDLTYLFMQHFKQISETFTLGFMYTLLGCCLNLHAGNLNG